MDYHIYSVWQMWQSFTMSSSKGIDNISKLTFFGHRHDSSHPPVRVCTTLADSSTLCKGIDEAVYPHLLCPAWPATSQLCRPIRNIRSQCVKLITVDLLSNLGHDESSRKVWTSAAWVVCVYENWLLGDHAWNLQVSWRFQVPNIVLISSRIRSRMAPVFLVLSCPPTRPIFR